MDGAGLNAGLYEVNVDFSGFGPSIHVSLFDELDADLLNVSSLELFPLLPSSQEATSSECLLSQGLQGLPTEYFLYLITPPGQPSEYVCRLPYFLSDMYFMGLENVSFTTVPTWYTFSNMQSVVCITFTTAAPVNQLIEQLQQVGVWADTIQSWVTTYNQLLPASASPNLASIVCTSSSILICDPDREEPTWLPHDAPVFRHNVTITPPAAGSQPPDWVTHVCSHLDAYSLHSRLSQVVRHHVEPRRQSPCLFTPPPQPESSAVPPAAVHAYPLTVSPTSAFQSPRETALPATPLPPTPLPPTPSPATPPPATPPPATPPARSKLAAGDCVIYLCPSLDGCVCTTVVSVAGDSVVLETGDSPVYLAKFDPLQHTLLSDLQPLSCFL